MNKELQKLLTGEQVKPKQRFLLGLALASTYHRNGRDAFIQNASVCGLSAEEIAATIAFMKECDLPTRPGYILET